MTATDHPPGRFNGKVGQSLVSESDGVRVWLIRLQPGDYLAPHCHQLNYFWTATTAGRARSVYDDGRTVERDYAVGDTAHFRIGAGEFFIHDLRNTGDSVLCFTTVEFLDSANEPLPIGQSQEDVK
ncbi:hypothetical protein XI06_14390 [Bradyrhizobium sp. CCBAU 11434]|uniref:cupin domain-containing protein n=1 Tax=Bradyrhizobium sp. CCBAU 11434 TaxID=1630885 RepID=UPI0023057CA8|nr:hypothetical protein [Bradyrhizobium sp. CCBAU 11434]MDA9521509.1 hypothetical protein [Bradyrhizobium sp. CCBAU 11434]